MKNLMFMTTIWDDEKSEGNFHVRKRGRAHGATHASCEEIKKMHAYVISQRTNEQQPTASHSRHSFEPLASRVRKIVLKISRPLVKSICRDRSRCCMSTREIVSSAERVEREREEREREVAVRLPGWRTICARWGRCWKWKHKSHLLYRLRCCRFASQAIRSFYELWSEKYEK